MGKLFKIFCPVILLLFVPSSAILQPQNLQFDHINSEGGLSNNCVHSILQDSRGFMWFGTSDGLNRWDGYTVKIFTYDANDSNSLSSNYIQCLVEDDSGFIWVGTINGLNLYIPDTEKFLRYLKQDENSGSISDNVVHAIYEDQSGSLWIGTDYGLNRFDRETGVFIHYLPEPENRNPRRSNNTVNSICPDKHGNLLLGTGGGLIIFEVANARFNSVPYPFKNPRNPKRDWWWQIAEVYRDSKGIVWIGMESGGLVKYNMETEEFHLFGYDSGDPSRFDSRNASSICEDNSGVLWVGSQSYGLHKYEREFDRFMACKHDSRNETGMNSSMVLDIYCDKQGNVWIGTYDNGVNKLSKWRKTFIHYIHDTASPNSIGQGEVTDICQDEAGNLWVTTWGSGLSIFNHQTKQFTRLKRDFSNPQSISQDILSCVYADKAGTIWMGAVSLNRYNWGTGDFTLYKNNPIDPLSHSDDTIESIYEDRNGTLWLGTTTAGLERFDRTDETFKHYRHESRNTNSLSHNHIYSMFHDKSGIFWVGTGDGLCQLVSDEKDNEHFMRYQHDPLDSNSISGKVIYAIYEDEADRFWIGTDNGLNLLDRNKKIFTAFAEKDGLPGNFVYDILEDDHGNLWLRTNRGIVKFHPESKSFKVFDELDGLKFCKSIEFGYKAFYKAKSGEIYSGGANSVAVFSPDSLKDNPTPPPIVLTDFKINNEMVKIGPDSPLQKSITVTDNIKLAHHQDIISFEFAALDYTSPGKNLYAYKMDGIDPDWVYTDASRRFAAYTNLDPGKYVFKVKASNNDGLWNEEGASVKIIITPPWWKTWWAYALYITFLALTLYTLRLYDLRRQRLKHQLELEHIHAEKLEELDRMKSHFFANISHEFRTPLTLILGPLEKLIAEVREGNLKQQFQIMRRNGRNLLNLINQLLDISRLESGSMTLRARCQNVVSLLKRMVEAFISAAERKQITLEFKAAEAAIVAYVDQDKLEKIVNNLLSNAFKFTPAGGKISVCLASHQENLPAELSGKFKHGYVEIVVADTGIGILTDKIDKIFDRFYQVDASQTRSYGGTGIGLALAKELVELHHGEISVASEKGMGTTFIVRLPLGNAHLQAEKIVEASSVENAPEEPFAEWEETGVPETGAEAQHAQRVKSAPILLVVEDNQDMRAYLCSLLSSAYRVMESVDGQDGLEKALRIIPDLIISDVMMPKMDGFELCARLKTDERTSHVPVILLTARASAESRIAGLGTGADDYIAKPFEARELQARVKNLIEQRRKLQERFRKEAALQPHVVAVTSTDEKFLQKALAVVEQRMSDEDFSVEIFGREVGMSRVQLHRKLRALTDHSAGEFIRTLRLNRAAQLLAQHGGNITEVAYEVGFNNLSYFAKCFHQQFGVSPSTYAAGSSKTTPEE